MTEEQQEVVKKILLKLLEYMGISAEIETMVSSLAERSPEGGEETIIFNLKTQDSGILIGSRGINLAALQYLTRILVHKQLPEEACFVVDIEGYKKNHEEFLRELARQAASRVRDTKESLLLKPMLSYERRVVHSEISKLPDVVTESVGDEPERRVLIKLKN